MDAIPNAYAAFAVARHSRRWRNCTVNFQKTSVKCQPEKYSNVPRKFLKGRVAMSFPSSIKFKLTSLMILIGMVPLLITMAYTSYNTINAAFSSAEQELKVTNELIEKEVSSLLNSNFTALRLMAVNPSVQEYLTATPENRAANMKNLVQNANELFHDGSNIVVTGNDGQQLVRSDASKLVSLKGRDYFNQAMPLSSLKSP